MSPVDVPQGQLRIVILEPWYRGSHKAWVDGFTAASRHEVAVVALAEVGWRESYATGPPAFVDGIEDWVRRQGRPDLIIASSPIDLAAVLGLCRRSLADTPAVIYQHESQLLYPPGPKGGTFQRGARIDLQSLLAADAWITGSSFHRDALLNALPLFLASQWPGDPDRVIDSLAAKHHLLPVGISQDTPKRATEPAQKDPNLAPLILWNHRWEHDKNPSLFVHTMLRLAGQGIAFRLALAGASGRSGRRHRDKLVAQLSERVIHSGEADSATYHQLLADAAIVVSTSDHEFFGVSVAEAIAAGCWPVLPHRLSYPELVPTNHHPQHLYAAGTFESHLRTAIGLVAKGETASPDLAEHAAQFEWPTLVHYYDRLFAAYAAGDFRPGATE
ncbi:MAG: glycosyltransferase involved in cell wall biosynthesis [Candidatus Poriferisodalaceae bacterium]|jgi:glycosyltransferase involved in cell wall biosynthesis